MVNGSSTLEDGVQQAEWEVTSDTNVLAKGPTALGTRPKSKTESLLI